MAEPIIGGPNSPAPQAPRATRGGVMSAKPMRYSEPQGPIGIMRGRKAGLGGDNHGEGTHGTSEHMSGGSGIGGTIHPYGSQRCD